MKLPSPTTLVSLLLFASANAGQKFETAEAWTRSLAQDVELRVADAKGRLVRLSVKPMPAPGVDRKGVWPASPQLFVLPVASQAWSDAPRHLLQSGKTIGEFVAAFELSQAEDYVAVLLAPGAPAVIRPFHYERGAKVSALSMRLPAYRAMGGVSIDVRHPDGGVHFGDVTLHILDRASGIPLIAWDGAALQWGPQGSESRPAFTLPAGEYELVALERPLLDYHGRVRSGRKYAAGRVLFELLAGEQLDLIVPFTEGARLEVRVEGQASDADLASVRRRRERLGMSYLLPDSEAARHISLRLERRSGYPLSVEFQRYAFANTSAAGLHIQSGLPLQKSAVHETSEPLPAGRYTLEARLPGARRLLREVQLRSGETLVVELDFGAR